MEEYDYIFKVVLTGPAGVGKTRFLMRYADGVFYDSYLATLGVDFKIKQITSPDTKKIVKLQIWDTAGRERFRQITSTYYRGARGVFLLFDCTDRESFLQIPKILEQLAQYASENIKKILVATKIDLSAHRQVPYEEAKQLADHLGIPYIETSSKDDMNVTEAVNILTRSIEQDYREKVYQPVPPPVTSNGWRCTLL